MQGTVHGFSYGAVTPAVAFVMACLGAALGLRCTTRSLRTERSFKAGWLALGATSIGSGIWTMHFIAMVGFSVEEVPVGYDRPVTFASLAVAVVMVGIGIFLVGYRGATRMALVTGGTITGLGVASMHYLGMAGMRLDGQFEYDTLTVSLSVVIAVVASTAALWAAVSRHGLLTSLGAAVVMGAAVSGMHYTGMAALQVHLHPAAAAGHATGDRATALLVPMLIGPACFLLLAAVVVMFDPLVVMGTPDWNDRDAPPGAGRAPGIPAQRQVPRFGTHADPASFHTHPREPVRPRER
ncbi:MHYT domain-containing protein [Streptomyces sp. ITFR-16]|uniref:MHYT domain-containing protein n=1 Tax=Streptomyces sp. ITFR-16 TaxID=3075198 RepID=UPI002889092C|nr:MHYT domain-containing protein [Streptomyces sp. ITFR-16]WNI25392.1 MHYT domain-containing protein [Streptomyces sp. ITFR-16]